MSKHPVIIRNSHQIATNLLIIYRLEELQSWLFCSR